MKIFRFTLLSVAVVLAFVAGTQASIVTVTVGDPGNAADTRYASPGYGSVAYMYNIGKYEVTNSQYAGFLNAVATVGDPYGLYNMNMSSGWNDIGGISRSGSGTGGDPWVYATRPSRGNRPVNYVSWGDAARFANWMHNGQPAGTQDASTTEDGSYLLNGATSSTALMAITREQDAMWIIPSEDEWYKAAYYKGSGINAGYWDYPTQSDAVPAAEAAPGTNLINGSANYYDGGYVADPTYYTTEVGAYKAMPSDSAYRTFDQGGNVFEWVESTLFGSGRGLRGGSFYYDGAGQSGGGFLHAAYRDHDYVPTHENHNVGFRIALVPEPGTLSLLALGALFMTKRRR